MSSMSMRNTGITIVSLDLILLVMWACGGWYNISQQGTDPCFSFVFVVHFLIVCHFILIVVITAIVDLIIREEKKAKDQGKVLHKLPYAYYTPLTWIVSSLVALLGDVSLLSFSISEFRDIGFDDKCRNSRIFHIAFDSLAVFVCLLTILWFLVVSFTSIEDTPVPVEEKGMKKKIFRNHQELDNFDMLKK